MFDRFSKESRGVMMRAHRQAERLGDSTFEVQHIFLAIAEYPVGPAGAALAAHGLTEERLTDAVRQEFSDAIASLGEQAPQMMSSSNSNPKFGQSAKLALERAAHESAYQQAKKITVEHLLLGVLASEAGVIPRLLDRLNVSASEIKNSLFEEQRKS